MFTEEPEMEGQSCAIIGFGPGLGSAYARVFHGAGYALALLSRSAAPMDEQSSGPAIASYACDVSDPGEVTSVLETVETGRVSNGLDDIEKCGFQLATRRVGATLVPTHRLSPPADRDPA